MKNVIRKLTDYDMKRLIYTLLMMCLFTGIEAQNTVRIHYKDGGYADVPMAKIDSLTFIKAEAEETEEATLIGSWLWGKQGADYYELLTFNQDHTYTGYDNYYTYGFDTQTYGWYSYYGAMLTLQSNGFGYNRRYNWFVTTLTANALEVMTKMGPFTYYRLQKAVIRLQTGQRLSCEAGASFVFADGIVAKIDDEKLVGLVAGTTYILKKSAEGMILAYQVVVE